MPALSAARDVGVQSWSFREFKTPELLATKLKEVGATATELCGVQPGGFDDPTRHDAPIATLKQAGVRVFSIGVQTFTGNIAVERQWFEFAKKAGAKYISAHFRVDSFRDAIKVASGLSEAYGIKLALHCHGGYMFGGSWDEIDHITTLGFPYVGVNIDTAWCMQAAGNPVEWAKKLLDPAKKRLYGVHYKDFVFDRAGKWSETIPGDGNLALKDFVGVLESQGFDGFAVVEYEADPKDPTAAIKTALERIRAV